MKKTNRSLVYTLALAIMVVIGVVAGSAQARPKTQQDIAVERAIEFARSRGLQQSQPTEFIVKQTALAEWFSIIGFHPGPDATKVGLDPDKAIWIVAMKGSIEWSGPGRQTGGAGDTFDNISIALSVDTLEYVGSFAAGPDEQLPLGLQR